MSDYLPSVALALRPGEQCEIEDNTWRRCAKCHGVFRDLPSIGTRHACWLRTKGET